jgi:hypothetical protein
MIKKPKRSKGNAIIQSNINEKTALVSFLNGSFPWEGGYKRSYHASLLRALAEFDND